MIQRKDFIFFEEENCFIIINSKVNSINMRKFINKYNLSHIAIVTDKPRCLYLDLSETKLKSIIIRSKKSDFNIKCTNCTALESFSSDADMIIENDAFKGCSSLKTFDVKKIKSFAKKTYIGKSAFEGCSSLESIDIPSIDIIGPNTFRNCTSLKYVNIQKCEEICAGAFSGCTSLIKFDFSNVSKIDDKVICIDTGFNKIIDERYYIEGAFSGCTSLKDIIIGTQLYYIGEYTFEDCTALKKVYIRMDATHEEIYDDKVHYIQGADFHDNTFPKGTLIYSVYGENQEIRHDPVEV